MNAARKFHQPSIIARQQPLVVHPQTGKCPNSKDAVVVRLKLACAPQRYATTDPAQTKTTDASVAPAGPVAI